MYALLGTHKQIPCVFYTLLQHLLQHTHTNYSLILHMFLLKNINGPIVLLNKEIEGEAHSFLPVFILTPSVHFCFKQKDFFQFLLFIYVLSGLFLITLLTPMQCKINKDVYSCAWGIPITPFLVYFCTAPALKIGTLVYMYYLAQLYVDIFFYFKIINMCMFHQVELQLNKTILVYN